MSANELATVWFLTRWRNIHFRLVCTSKSGKHNAQLFRTINLLNLMNKIAVDMSRTWWELEIHKVHFEEPNDNWFQTKSQ